MTESPPRMRISDAAIIANSDALKASWATRPYSLSYIRRIFARRRIAQRHVEQRKAATRMLWFEIRADGSV